MRRPPHTLAWLALTAAAVVCMAAGATAAPTPPSFTIGGARFLRDGTPFNIISGSVHYSRIHPDLWRDRLTRLAAMGLNAIEVYVPWSYHQPTPNTTVWSGSRDVVKFFQTAHDVGLLVLLRAGPYICGEYDFGGIPPFMLNSDVAPNVTLRTNDAVYLRFVDAWWAELLPRIAPLLYSAGGPVVMVQVENEFGSYGDVSGNDDDRLYMQHLVSVARRHLGNDVILYTTDGGSTSFLTHGTLKGDAVYSAVDFGPGGDVSTPFAAQAAFNTPDTAVPMCTEYYSGWLTHWGDTIANRSTATLVSGLSALLNMNASVSLYMGHGGTSFGFLSGANGGGASFSPQITSYDYDAPVAEDGRHGYGSDGTDKYAAVRAVLLQHRQPGTASPPAEPPAPVVTAYAATHATHGAELLAAATLNALVVNAAWNMSDVRRVEALNQSTGLVLYTAVVDSASSVDVTINFARDRARVFRANGSAVGSAFWRGDNATTYTVAGSTASVLVETCGHLNYGRQFYDPKGLEPGDVSVSPAGVSWSAQGMPLEAEQVAAVPLAAVSHALPGPAVYRATLTVSGAATDTYLALPGWGKGYVWVNGFNLGRYWNARGPQEALYVPGPVLAAGDNTVLVVELDAAAAGLPIHFSDAAEFAGPQCVVNGAAVTAGAYVAMFECDAGSGDAQLWSATGDASSFLLHVGNSSSPACLGSGSRTDPSTGKPAAEVVACSDAAKLAYDASTGEIRLAATPGTCLDITAHGTANDSHVEWYACNGGGNQVWSPPAVSPAAAARVTSGSNCLSVCTVQ